MLLGTLYGNCFNFLLSFHYISLYIKVYLWVESFHKNCFHGKPRLLSKKVRKPLQSSLNQRSHRNGLLNAATFLQSNVKDPNSVCLVAKFGPSTSFLCMCEKLLFEIKLIGHAPRLITCSLSQNYFVCVGLTVFEPQAIL